MTSPFIPSFGRPAWALAVLLAVAASACESTPTPDYFVAPTMDLSAPAGVVAPQAASAVADSTAAVAPTEPPPTPTPDCFDDLDYLQDLTIPDGSIVAPGQVIDKRWQVRNSGTCNWDQRYSLRLISGDPMGAETTLDLYPARAGSDATLQILFSAPAAPGAYECQWQAADPDGTPFGDAFYMQIVVGS